ncbi:MAG: pantoate--beta-alanine ligase, partial [Ferruginibacter sp.]
QLFLGQKDYQQCMVIKKLVSLKNYKLELKIVPTVRENNGLALSSRNTRLSAADKQIAVRISQGLFIIQKQIKPGKLDSLKLKIKKDLEENGLTIDYVEIADTLTLAPLELWDGKTSIVALIAAWVSDVRLIDSLVLS